jgi:hypothetical protein
VLLGMGKRRSLQRPGLEQIRDLAAEGQLQAVLVYSPDRLSRKYAYRVLLLEEFARHGVETGCIDGVPAIAMFRPASSSRPAYFIRLNWHDERIAQVRDFRYVSYIAGEAIFAGCSSSVS